MNKSVRRSRAALAGQRSPTHVSELTLRGPRFADTVRRRLRPGCLVRGARQRHALPRIGGSASGCHALNQGHLPPMSFSASYQAYVW
jgi:hypothetical protein